MAASMSVSPDSTWPAGWLNTVCVTPAVCSSTNRNFPSFSTTVATVTVSCPSGHIKAPWGKRAILQNLAVRGYGDLLWFETCWEAVKKITKGRL